MQQGQGMVPGIDVYKRQVPCGAAKSGGQIFGQHIFAGGLAAGQQQVFAAEQGRQCLLPDLPAIICLLYTSRCV